jgi:hypothetical protein
VTSITRSPPRSIASATGNASSAEEKVTAGRILWLKAVYSNPFSIGDVPAINVVFISTAALIKNVLN